METVSIELYPQAESGEDEQLQPTQTQSGDRQRRGTSILWEKQYQNGSPGGTAQGVEYRSQVKPSRTNRWLSTELKDRC